MLLADISSSPVAVTSCTTGVTTSDMLVKTDGNYRIEFVDNDSRTVTEIRFVVHVGEQQIYIKDAGKFSPGVAVTHRFPDRGGEIVLVGSPQIWCEVKSVRFADDTEWLEPASGQ